MKKFIFLVAILCFAASAHAQVVVAANGVGSHLVFASDGVTPLVNGDLIRLGTFNSSGISILATSNSLSTLDGDFTALGEGNVGGGTLTETPQPAGNTMDINSFGGTSGAFYGSFSGVSSSYFATGTATQLYMWVFNSSDPNTATQWGIFDAPSWMFPANLGTVTMGLGSANIDPLRGSVDGTDFELANLSGVPEPSTFTLMAGAVIVGSLVLRRRRHRLLHSVEWRRRPQ